VLTSRRPDSYLRAEAIVDLAVAHGATAIHPGYGFLSENEAFAQACAQAQVTFIGPPIGALRAMGSKSAAKALMSRAGVPLVPGYHGDDQDPAALQREADAIGYPLLIKPPLAAGARACGWLSAARISRPPLPFASARTGKLWRCPHLA